MQPINPRTRSIWTQILSSAYRAALACTLVGITTLYSPPSITRYIAFPAFSYVVVILIVTDSTLGDALHSCWLALYATLTTVGPAILSLWVIGPTRFTSATISLAVMLAAFVVVVPENTKVLTKRIALGQIVLIYVVGFINGDRTQPVFHPINVAISTGVGVLACVVALLVPFPRLASVQMKQSCKQLADNASERLNLYVKAFNADDSSQALACISQAKSLVTCSSKLLQNIKQYQEGMKWEKLPFKCLKQYYTNPIEKLQDLQQPLRGMEMAITTAKISHPTNFQHNDFKQALHGLEQHITSLIKQHKTCESSSTVPKSNTKNMTKPLQTLQSIPTSTQHLSSFFFLFCFKLLHNKSLPKPSLPHKSLSTTTNTNSSSKQDELSSKWAWPINTKRLIHSLKSSLALGLSVLFGLLYSKENGFWSALPVAISYAAVREATFKVANIKAQGTVIGTVYGVIGCFLFEKYLPIRFLSLLPWFIFTSFLRRSRMYGPAGGISAVIGAVLILGRKNFGPPSDFAIARIVETFIGLSCSIMIDLVFQPTRASTLAKAHLCKSLGSLSECIGSIGLGIGPQVQINQAQFVKSLKRLKSDVIELGKYIEEADVEPNFWFLPFNSECYHKLLVSLNKIVDMLGFVNESMSLIEDELKENLSKLDGDFEHLKEIIGLCIKCYENVSLVKSIDVLDDQLEKKKVSFDVELGKSNWVSELDEEKIVSEFLQHADEVVGKMEVVKSDVVLGLSGLGFCMESLLKETKQIGDAIKEVVQWENPSKNINLVEISCKVQALYNNDN